MLMRYHGDVKAQEAEQSVGMTQPVDRDDHALLSRWLLRHQREVEGIFARDHFYAKFALGVVSLRRQFRFVSSEIAGDDADDMPTDGGAWDVADVSERIHSVAVGEGRGSASWAVGRETDDRIGQRLPIQGHWP